jgi:hypothetical protein
MDKIIKTKQTILKHTHYRKGRLVVEKTCYGYALLLTAREDISPDTFSIPTDLLHFLLR